MKKRGYICLFFASLIFVIAFGACSYAWEFKLSGEAEWRYRYFARTGPNDLSGNAEVAQADGHGINIGLAGPNLLTVDLQGYSQKGSDAAYAEHRLWLYPTLRINKAVKLNLEIALQANLNGTYQSQLPPGRLRES